MHRHKKALLIALFFCSKLVFSQQEAPLPFVEDAVKEFSFGLNTNTNGKILSGFNFRYVYQEPSDKRHVYHLEIVNVSSEKERPEPNRDGIYFKGKINYLFAIRPSYGREIKLFNKYPENGVRLNAVWGLGPTIGLVKPYFVKYQVDSNSTTVVVPYDPKKYGGQSSNSFEGAGLFTGMGSSKLNLGIHARTALNFEFSPDEEYKLGVELGATWEAFTKKNILFEDFVARRFYSAFFVHIYYGFTF
jgi:hypothetical protein